MTFFNHRNVWDRSRGYFARPRFIPSAIEKLTSPEIRSKSDSWLPTIGAGSSRVKLAGLPASYLVCTSDTKVDAARTNMRRGGMRRDVLRDINVSTVDGISAMPLLPFVL